MFDGRLLTLFPRALMNTAVSPTLLVKDRQARIIENMIPNSSKAGSGAKRYGLGTLGNPAAAEFGDGPFEYLKSDGTIQLIAYFVDGSLKTYNAGTGNYSDIKTGLSTLGTFGCLPFNGKLICWNGIDQPFSWDGSTCTDLGEYVTDVKCSAKTWVSNQSITIQPGTGRTDGDYPVNRSIRVTFASAGVVTATVASTSYNAGTNTLTITVMGTPFPGSSDTVNTVEYYAKPPCFSFMFAELDILWGLTPGELKAKTYRGNDGMKVYFQDAANNENSWYDYSNPSTSTQEVRYINLRNKVKRVDELVGISSIEGSMCFHGRKHLIIYAGNDPWTAGGFEWQKTIPVGTVHGKLIQAFPSDTLFMTPYGARSLRKVFTTETLKVEPDLGSDIDPTIKSKIKTLLSEDTAYKKARSFYYEADGLYGFKLDDDGLLIYELSEQSKGWVLFTGYFSDARGYCGCTDGRLLVTRGSQLYAYGNGADTTVGEVYADNGEAIYCQWWTPWIQAGARWSNHAFQVILESATDAQFYIDRFINYDSAVAVTTQFNVSGDGAQFDVSHWDEDYFDGSPVNPVESDKFLADDSFSFRLRCETTTGPLAVLGVRPIGR